MVIVVSGGIRLHFAAHPELSPDDDMLHPMQALLPGVPWIESPFFEEFAEQVWTDPERLRIAREMHTQGFSVIDFPDPDFDAIAETIRRDLAPQFDLDRWRTVGDISLRVQDAWQSHEGVRRLAANPQVLEILSDLYGRKAWPFQTLNFPVGTQQSAHSDAVHFSSVPDRFMCGVWVALEDIHEDAGPLEYYPGSHRWPAYGNDQLGLCASDHDGPMGQGVYEPIWRELIRLHGTAPQRFLARKGQAVIWAANVLHGGSPQHDKNRTRWSQVTHYYFEGCAWYTPMGTDLWLQKAMVREPRNIAGGQAVMKGGYLGKPVAPQAWQGSPAAEHRTSARRTDFLSRLFRSA